MDEAVGFGSPCLERRGFEISANITSPQWNFRIPQNSAMGLIAESFNLERTSSDQLVQLKQEDTGDLEQDTLVKTLQALCKRCHLQPLGKLLYLSAAATDSCVSPDPSPRCVFQG
ncbi:hypothetical protein AV530_019480 [Patagioenas fasciata monilis]|uniref:Uncharacterized protein n=1 Tax=Patagioenas fasciata monilis TaxID=372326 RepID=A0A1V4JDS5_PATFA|nr:hypothetical protein AV530_019480 [Patagioenas fasciata monilis]